MLWKSVFFFGLALAVQPLFAQTEIQKAVEEFRIQTRDLGLRPDSPRGQNSKGTAAPQWHGRIFENFRNDFLDAVPHEIAQRGGTKSLRRRNQFGFNIAGPLAIPRLYRSGRRTFFSVSYEGVRDRTAQSFLQTLPTLDERTGNFSATVDQAGKFLPIYDPTTTVANPSFDATQPVTEDNLEYLRIPFVGNRIDPFRLDPVALKALDYYPPPNASAGPFFRNNYFLVSPETNNADGVIGKVDHSIRARHRISVNLNYTKGLNGAAARLPTAANPGPPDREYRELGGGLEHVFTKSAQTVNTLSFYASNEISQAGEQGQPDYAGNLGLRGSSALAFPSFSLAPYVGMGRANPQTRSTWTNYQWRDGLSIRRGKHSLMASFRHSRYQVNSFQAAYPAGSLRFDEGLTSLPGIVGTGHGFASFLLGLAGYGEKTYVVSPSYFRTYSNYVSVREQYQARAGLTLSISLGLSHQSPQIEKYNRQSSVDLSVINPANGRPGAMIVSGLNGVGRSFQPHYAKLEPSVSLAWNPLGDSATVVRASFSRYYGYPWINASQWGTQAFNAAPIYLSTNTQLEPALRLSEGLPPLGHPLPDLRPDALNDTNADFIYRGRLQPAYNTASLSVERQLPLAAILTAGATHATGKDVYAGNGVANLNALPVSALAYRDELNDEAFRRVLRPYPQYKSLNVGGLYPAGRYQREAAFISVEKRATAGLSLNFRYDWTRQWDDYSGGRQQFANRRSEWFLSFATPHRVTLTYMFELPIGRGKPLFAYSDWRRHLTDGWSLSGSSSYFSGEPIALRPQFNNTGGVVSSLRVNVVPGVNPHVACQGPNLWFNPAAFDQPEDFTLGNAPRSFLSLINPSSQNHDLSANKRFALAGGKTLEFSAVALNFLNHANWYDPDPVIGPASAPNVNAGKIIGSFGGRVLQVGLRYSF